MKIQSFRFRLTLLFVVIFGATLVVFSGLMYSDFVRTHQQERDAALFNFAKEVADNINFDWFGKLVVPENINESPGANAPVDTAVNEENDATAGSDVAILDNNFFPFNLGKVLIQIRGMDQKILFRSKELQDSEIPWHNEDAKLLSSDKTILRTYDSSHFAKHLSKYSSEYRVLNYLVEKPLYPALVLQVAVPMIFIEKETMGLLRFFYIVIPLMLIISSLLGYFFASRALQPVNAIIATANAIGPEQLSARVPLPSVKDEMHQLATTINRLLSRLEQAFRSQERFVSDASHQMKTPLAILRGEIEVLQKSEISEEKARTFLNSALQEVEHLTKLVNNLLLLAQMDAGEASIVLSEVRLDEVILEAVSRIQPLAQNKKVKIQMHFAQSSADDNYSMSGDSELILTMLQSLLENAVKYSPEERAVEVILQKNESGLSFSVKDFGPGISSAEQKSIFNRFYRDRNSKGQGLGLSIAKRIVELHGGLIKVISASGDGCTFQVTFYK